MDDRVLIEILAAHADQLNRVGEGTHYLEAFPDYRDALAPLFALAERVKRVLVPLKVRKHFRDQLRRDLAIAAPEKQALAPQSTHSHRLEWVIGAAVIGVSVSLLGIVALWRRSRNGRAAVG